MDIDSEWLERERIRARDWLVNYFEWEYDDADRFIGHLWADGFAIVPREFVDDLFGFVAVIERQSTDED